MNRMVQPWAPCKTVLPLEKNPSVVFLLCADLNICCSKTKSSNDNPRHTARQINSTSVLISITVHSTEIVTIPKHTKIMYITGIHNSCMSQHNYIPTKSDVFIIKQRFIKAKSVHNPCARLAAAPEKAASALQRKTAYYMGLCNIHVSVQPSTEHDTLMKT